MVFFRAISFCSPPRRFKAIPSSRLSFPLQSVVRLLPQEMFISPLESPRSHFLGISLGNFPGAIFRGTSCLPAPLDFFECAFSLSRTGAFLLAAPFPRDSFLPPFFVYVRPAMRRDRSPFASLTRVGCPPAILPHMCNALFRHSSSARRTTAVPSPRLRLHILFRSFFLGVLSPGVLAVLAACSCFSIQDLCTTPC